MKSPYRPFFALIVLLLLVSLACIFGGTTATQPAPVEPTPEIQAPEQPATEAPADTEAPVVTEAPVATEPPVQAQQFFTEEFDTDLSNWTKWHVTGSTETNSDSQVVKVEDSRLSLDFNTKYLYTYFFYDPYEYENVSVETKVENRGMNKNNISLICRYSEDEGWYEFNIANNGLYNILYGFYQPDGDIGYAKIADGGSTKIKSGKDINVYKIVCRDRKLSLYINGTETRVLEENDHVLRKGKVGFSASSFDQLPIKVEFDWVTIAEP